MYCSHGFPSREHPRPPNHGGKGVSNSRCSYVYMYVFIGILHKLMHKLIIYDICFYVQR